MKIHPKSYSLGYVQGCSDEREQYRAAAFGAIRRAAQEARDWEAFGGNGDSIRRAIRSAIGSEKR